ncbi:MAG: hypothetical protein K2X28_03980 [Alphaproteobacteria bacterium]|nr:hypothetical protein [Alphaproteobacteria bacterium]
MPKSGDLPERVINLLRGGRQKSRDTVSGDDKKLSAQPQRMLYVPLSSLFLLSYFNANTPCHG